MDRSSHSQNRFWCKLWVFLLHCSTQGGDADLQKPRPCACALAPPTLLHSVPWDLGWRGQTSEVPQAVPKGSATAVFQLGKSNTGGSAWSAAELPSRVT